jgi:small subunit ribosomal protein S17
MTDAPAQAAAPAKRQHRRMVTGVVTAANKTPKTIKVSVQYQARHPKYGKIMRRQTKYTAHDEKGEAHAGDMVELMECRPISKTKTWRLVRVVHAAPRD